VGCPGRVHVATADKWIRLSSTATNSNEIAPQTYRRE
jgi:hypothetical protein